MSEIKRSGAENGMHQAAMWLTGHGISLFGSRILGVRGRKSGQTRFALVNLLEVDGKHYLVAPRGQTQWACNLRAAGEAEIKLGKRVEGFRVVELADDEKPALLRAYLKRWGWQVNQFFDGVTAKSTDEELLRVAPSRPIFRLS